MKEREDLLTFPVVSAITGEFSPDFLEWWPFKGVPVLANHQDPYADHLSKVIGLKYVFRPESGGWVVPITAYCGMWRAQVMRVSRYRAWVAASTKSIDKGVGL